MYNEIYLLEYNNGVELSYSCAIPIALRKPYPRKKVSLFESPL